MDLYPTIRMRDPTLESSYTSHREPFSGSEPIISVIIPVFNSARTLDECIGSVVKQTYPKWEILVIDSDSRDGTAVMAKNGVKCLEITALPTLKSETVSRPPRETREL